MFKKILVPIYNLENIDGSLASAAEIARRFESEIILLYVASFICHFAYDAPVGLADSCRVDEKEYEFATSFLEKAKTELATEGIHISTVIQPTHDPMTGITSFIQHEQVDLVILANSGSCKRHFFQRTLSEKLILAKLDVGVLVL